MTIRVQINLVLYVATAADDSDVRLHVDGGEGIVVGEILDLLPTRLLPLVVLDDDEGVPDHIAVERDVSNITGGIGIIVGESFESGHGQVESLGCYKKLDVRVVRVSITAKKGRVNWNSGKVQEANKKRTGGGLPNCQGKIKTMNRRKEGKFYSDDAKFKDVATGTQSQGQDAP